MGWQSRVARLVNDHEGGEGLPEVPVLSLIRRDAPYKRTRPQPPEPTPKEREEEELWIEEQHRKHAPLTLRIRGWLRRLLG